MYDWSENSSTLKMKNNNNNNTSFQPTFWRFFQMVRPLSSPCVLLKNPQEHHLANAQDRNLHQLNSESFFKKRNIFIIIVYLNLWIRQVGKYKYMYIRCQKFDIWNWILTFEGIDIGPYNENLWLFLFSYVIKLPCLLNNKKNYNNLAK